MIGRQDRRLGNMGGNGVELCAKREHGEAVKTSIELDDALSAELRATVSRVREKQATVLRLAIRAGLPVVASLFQGVRPEGYFADAYPQPRERRALEAAMSKVQQKPER